MGLRKAFCLFVLALVAGACGGDPSTQFGEESKPLADVTVVPTSGATVGSLGQGRDYAKESMRDVCLKVNNTIPQGTPYMAALFNSVMSKEDVSSMLGFSADAKAHYGLFDGGVKASFARSTAESAYAMVLYWSADYGAGWQTIDSTSSTWNVSPTAPDFRLRCGDQVLRTLMKGGTFLVQYKIDFSSRTDKENFQAAVNASYGKAATVNADLKQELSKLQSRASVTVGAFQSGGDPTKMLNGLAGAKDSDTSGAQAIVKCASANLDSCGVFMTNAVVYGTGTGIDQFPQNVKAIPGDQEYTFQDWSTYGGPVAPPLPESITDARNTLRTKFDLQAEMKQRLDLLRNGAVYVNGEVAPKLDAWAALVDANLRYLKDAKNLCYDVLEPGVPDSVQACASAVTDSALAAKGYSASPSLADLDAGHRFEASVFRNDAGWTASALEGDTAGQTASKVYLRGLRINPRSSLKNASICYSVYQNAAWTPEVCDGSIAGNTSISKAATKVRVRLKNGAKNQHICYSMYQMPIAWGPPAPSWTSEVCDNAEAGSPFLVGTAVRIRITP